MAFITYKIALKVKNAFEPSANLLHWLVEKDDAEICRHFLSQTAKLLLTVGTEHDQTFVVSFFVKFPFDDREQSLVSVLVQREYKMYKKYLPALRRLSDAGELPFPTCYYLHDDGSIVLEDVRWQGYRSLNRSQLDLEHATCALTAIAKFHAFSVRLDEISPRVLDKVRGMEFLRMQSDVYNRSTMFGNRFLRLLTRVDAAFVVRNHDQLLRFKDKFHQTAIAEAACRPKAFNVLNHGDFWTSNMMFKYSKNGRLEGMKYFDFHFSHWSSPANDLIFFIMMSTDFETFENHFEQLLDVYLNTLMDTMRALGCRRTYTIEQLHEDVRSKYHYWILLLIVWAPLFYSTEDEFKGNNIAEYLVDGKKYQPVLHKWMSFFIKQCTDVPGCKLFVC